LEPGEVVVQHVQRHKMAGRVDLVAQRSLDQFFKVPAQVVVVQVASVAQPQPARLALAGHAGILEARRQPHLVLEVLVLPVDSPRPAFKLLAVAVLAVESLLRVQLQMATPEDESLTFLRQRACLVAQPGQPGVRVTVELDQQSRRPTMGDKLVDPAAVVEHLR
jgi:hypothetical protein